MMYFYLVINIYVKHILSRFDTGSQYNVKCKHLLKGQVTSFTALPYIGAVKNLQSFYIL